MRKIPFTLGAVLRVLAELVMIFPALYVLSGLAIDPPMHYIFFLELCVFALLGVLLRRLIPSGALQLLIGLPACVAIAIFLGLTFGDPEQPASFLLGMICAPLVFYRGKQHAQNDWNAILPTYAPCVIMVITLLIFAIVNFVDMLSPFQPVITVAGPIAFILSLFVMNNINRINLVEDHNKNKSASSTSVSKGIGLQNNMILAVITILGILLSGGPFMISVARMILKGIQTLLYYLFGWLFVPLESGGEAPIEEAPPEELIGFDYVEANPFWTQFFQIAIYVVFVLVVIAFAVLLFFIIRKVIRFFMDVFRQMSNQKGLLSGSSGDFEDTRESIVNLRDLPKKYMDSLRKKLAELRKRSPRWGELHSESERVRFLYRASLNQAVRSGYKHKSSYTPKEALDQASEALPQIDPVHDALTEAYDLVRYGEQTPTPGTAQDLKNQGKL